MRRSPISAGAGPMNVVLPENGKSQHSGLMIQRPESGLKIKAEVAVVVHAPIPKSTGDWCAVDEAVAALEQATTLEPGLKSAHYNLGYVYDAAGKTEAAVESYKRAIALDPGYFDAYLNLGALYSELGRHREAKVYFEKARQHASKLEEVTVSERGLRQTNEALEKAQGPGK